MVALPLRSIATSANPRGMVIHFEPSRDVANVIRRGPIHLIEASSKCGRPQPDRINQLHGLVPGRIVLTRERFTALLFRSRYSRLLALPSAVVQAHFCCMREARLAPDDDIECC